jgi:2'-5' RNA ligase
MGILMKRLFIGIEITRRKRLEEAYQVMRTSLRMERINWVSPENFHITLKFLGDTPVDDISQIMDRLKDLCKGLNPFTISLTSLGVFKNLHEPRVIWIGCNPCNALSGFQASLEKGLSEIGIEPEERTFLPHLTLGRMTAIRQINPLTQLITNYKYFEFQQQEVDRIILYESVLNPSGPKYDKVFEMMLPC